MRPADLILRRERDSRMGITSLRACGTMIFKRGDGALVFTFASLKGSR
jgi:hypothetical protein